MQSDEALRQAAATLAQIPQEGNQTLSGLEAIANGGKIKTVEPDTLWQLYDWLDSAIDAAYKLFPHIESALREINYMPPD
ncbi:MAG: hypothetical protein KDK05_00550 [Candidatus Competibacteraceae bacterium]|nr:hypothetical protein [Anaerolineales bacterium]MCB1713607.1 hypothetical protein [Candidatus Competibacteraceae bacterium]